MKKRFKSPLKEKKLRQISEQADFLHELNDISNRSKINFSYLDITQSNGYDFKQLEKPQLTDLLEKIKEHGKKSLEELQRTPIGGGSETSSRGCILKIYGDFPPTNKTAFREPRHTPAHVKWGTIRITGEFRLAGFVIPPEYHGEEHIRTKERFDKNTFYVVFLDVKHKFWTS